MKFETKQNGEGAVDVKIPIKTIVYMLLVMLGINAGTSGVVPKLFSNDNSNKYVTKDEYNKETVRDSSYNASMEIKINILLYEAGYNPETLIKYEDNTKPYKKWRKK